MVRQTRYMNAKPASVADVLREHAGEIRSRGASAVWVFGSRARGDNREDSDLDVLIDYDRSRKFSVYDLVGVQHLIEEITGLDVHIATVDSFSEVNLERVSKDAVQVI